MDMTKTPRKRNYPDDSFWCECGNQKGPERVACERCQHLDGLVTNKVIPALRDLGQANAYQIAAHTGTTVRTVLLTLRRMENVRRVKRTVVDGYGVYKLVYYS